MSHHLRIRLVGLIVWHNVQAKTGFRHAVIDNALLNVTFDALARVGGGQNSRGNAC
ncbi:hypothetical protein D3C71_1988420 [compost metagenome]